MITTRNETKATILQLKQYSPWDRVKFIPGECKRVFGPGYLGACRTGKRVSANQASGDGIIVAEEFCLRKSVCLLFSIQGFLDFFLPNKKRIRVTNGQIWQGNFLEDGRPLEPTELLGEVHFRHKMKKLSPYHNGVDGRMRECYITFT